MLTYVIRCCCAWMVVASLAALPVGAAEPTAFKLTDGDRVVLLGSTFIERAQSHGYLEAALTARYHRDRVQFRNLGWSGDTVFGEARAGFGQPEDGFDQLRQHVLEVNPTVILLCYGANESFAGKEGLDTFSAGLDRLLKALDESGARIVFLSPTPHEDLGPPLPDPKPHNLQLQLYTAAVEKAAAGRGESFANLFEALGKSVKPASDIPLTDNGLHLTEFGYWRATPLIEQALGLAPQDWRIDVDVPRRNIASAGTRIVDASISPDSITFVALDRALPLAPPPTAAPPAVSQSMRGRLVRVFGLPSGNYALSVDGQQVGVARAEQWAAGIEIRTGPDFEQAEMLRQTIRAKNELYFHRWRPQNVTYLFGFRKHEQGQNAVEIPQFDPLVEAAEQEIHELAAPVARHYEFSKVDDQ